MDCSACFHFTEPFLVGSTGFHIWCGRCCRWTRPAVESGPGLMAGKSSEWMEDAIVAATARVHGLHVATRNERDSGSFRWSVQSVWVGDSFGQNSKVKIPSLSRRMRQGWGYPECPDSHTSLNGRSFAAVLYLSVTNLSTNSE